MAYAFKCDRCKQYSEGIPYKVIMHRREHEICDACDRKLESFMKGVELVEDVPEDTTKDEEQVDPGPIKQLIYESYNSHDCETIYSCPHCGEKISSWSLIYQRQDGKDSHCPHCKGLVKEK